MSLHLKPSFECLSGREVGALRNAGDVRREDIQKTNHVEVMSFASEVEVAQTKHIPPSMGQPKVWFSSLRFHYAHTILMESTAGLDQSVLTLPHDFQSLLKLGLISEALLDGGG